MKTCSADQMSDPNPQLNGTEILDGGQCPPYSISKWRLCVSPVKARSHAPIFWHPRDDYLSPRTASCPFPTAPTKKSHQHLNP
ncbi:hypothetical protein [Coleofasciculus sp.]